MAGEKICRILIVEDNLDAANALAVTLERQAHEVQTARNGTEALAVAAYFRPHAVIIDIGLPGLDGFYVARELRKATPHLLIIAATGRSSAEDIQESRAAGCDHHLVKPLDLNAVTRLLSDWKVFQGCEA